VPAARRCSTRRGAALRRRTFPTPTFVQPLYCLSIENAVQCRVAVIPLWSHFSEAGRPHHTRPPTALLQPPCLHTRPAPGRCPRLRVSVDAATLTPTRLVPPSPVTPGPAVHQRGPHQAPRQGLQGCCSADAAAPHSHASHWIPPGRRADGPHGWGTRRLPPSVNTPAVLGGWGRATPCCCWGWGCAPDTAPCRVPCAVHTGGGGCCKWAECSVRRALHGAILHGRRADVPHGCTPLQATLHQSTPPQY
jgi:hypothetical protein